MVASVGTISGPIGNATLPIVQGAQLWAKYINQNGGLNGHPVKLLVYDDGGDVARHRAQVQEAAEQRKVVAFLANVDAITGQGSVDYINTQRVPVVGVSGGEGNWVYSSPMYFPQASAGLGFLRTLPGAMAQELVPKGKTKFGVVVCVEVPACSEIEGVFADSAKKLGYELVHRARTSVAQPDYTAECLAARNAGAEAVWLTLDANSVSRFATACGRQGYRPIFGIPSQGQSEGMRDDANLDGAVTPSQVIPYFNSGLPALDEFHQAKQLYGQGVPVGSGTVLGWTAGKLLEKAASALPEPPTREAVLAGLWPIKEDTLNGLTAPLTFTQDQPPRPLACWFTIVINNRSWTTPDGFKLHCL